MYRTRSVKAVIMLTAMFLKAVLSVEDEYGDDFGGILKCCPENHIVSHKGCSLNKSIKLRVPVYKNYNAFKIRDHSVKVNFVHHKVKCVVQGKDNMIIHLRYALQSNGDLWLPRVNRTFSNRHFCLEYFEGFGVVAVICPYGVEAIKNMTKSQDSKIPIDILLSPPFLFATFVVYAVLPERNLFGMCLMSYVFTLFWMYFLPSFSYIYGKFAKVKLSTCRVIAVITYYCIISSFIWTNAIAFDIWLKFSGKKGGSTNEKRRFCKYSIYAWGTPVIFVILVVALANSPPTKWYAPFAKRCWFQEGHPQLLYIDGPMGICLVMNVFFFVSTTWKIMKTRKETKILREEGSTTYNVEKDAIGRFKVYVKLMFVMGINWTVDLILVFLRWQSKTVDILLIIARICTCGVGPVIFFLFVCNKTNWKLLKKKVLYGNREEGSKPEIVCPRRTAATADTTC